MAVFKGLDPAQKYFPMVARSAAGSFYAQPPEPVQPGQVPEKKPELPPKKIDGQEHDEIWNVWEENELPGITRRTFLDHFPRQKCQCKVSLARIRTSDLFGPVRLTLISIIIDTNGTRRLAGNSYQ